ncbi:MAG: DEAD/DEAH box helicase [Planctomycetes bacterium]|nr:DEAD/DEAH box helicase [Planctomycetota bacterium]
MQKHPELPQSFADLGVEVRFLKALHKMQFVTPSDIQQAMIPPALQGRDILGQARTGTGKTAAFGLPVLQKVDAAGRLQAICLTPTRELAVQVTAELRRLAEFANLHIVPIYGGQKMAAQVHQLGRRPHFIVGTPGRVIDFMRRGSLSIAEARHVILDEVDRMLDIGFRDDIRGILSKVTAQHQTIFVSATIAGEIRQLARQYMQDPAEINVSQDKLTVDDVDQSFITVEGYDKFPLLRLILKQENPAIAIVFCNTKHAARKLAKKLFDAGIDAKEIHGDLVQQKRDRVMERFRRHQIRVLVATDLASRGIDVSAVSHIINYDIPPDPEVYVHRIGRTARMGARGVAISLVTREQGKELTAIEMLINREIPSRTVPGFVPGAPREAFHAAPRMSPPAVHAPEAVSAGVSSPAPAAAHRAAPKTLGGRFRPSRRSRRL